MKNRFLILMVLTAIPFSVQAWENCGQIGGVDSNCEYQISADGVLTIRPVDSDQDGVMPNYSYHNPLFPGKAVTTAPWAENGYETVTKIEIADGITNIGGKAFIGLSSKITSVVDIADSVTSIGDGAFAILPNLSKIVLPKNLQTLDHAVFQDDRLLENVDLPETLLEMSGLGNPFVRTGITSLSLPDSLLDNEGYNKELLTDYSDITTLYCSKKNEKKCSDLVAEAKASGKAKEGLKYEIYEKYGDNYIYDGKFYSSLGDIGTTNHVKKRIYTIDEANAVSGKKNTFKIRYK